MICLTIILACSFSDTVGRPLSVRRVRSGSDWSAVFDDKGLTQNRKLLLAKWVIAQRIKGVLA